MDFEGILVILNKFYDVFDEIMRVLVSYQNTCKTRAKHVQNTCFVRTQNSCVQGAWISVQGACFPVQKPVQNTYFWCFRGCPFLIIFEGFERKNDQKSSTFHECI